MDREVYEAVFTATQNNNQPDKVSRRLMRWLEELSDGNATLSSQDDVKAALNTILEAIQIGDYQEDDED